MQLQVDYTRMEFKIDTGADVNILCEDAFHKLTPSRTLEPAGIPLQNHGGELLCLGRFNAKVSYKGKSYLFKSYVVCGSL